MSAIRAKVKSLNLKSADLWVNEAEFGFNQIREHVAKLPEGSVVLEVGCGSGILLTMLAEAFPGLKFCGMEPFGEGFSALKDLNTLVQEHGVTIEGCGYETYQSATKFDLIFCVNVFEHVQNWRDFVVWASSSLQQDSMFIALCPNYSFPYESHFKIPVLFTKGMTYTVFHQHIRKFETRHQVEGLWSSLNFVKKREVKNYLAKHPELGLKVRDDVTIIDDMLERATSDPQFRERQSTIGRLALLMKNLGIFRIVKLFPNQLPYMKLLFRKTNTADIP